MVIKFYRSEKLQDLCLTELPSGTYLFDKSSILLSSEGLEILIENNYKDELIKTACPGEMEKLLEFI